MDHLWRTKGAAFGCHEDIRLRESGDDQHVSCFARGVGTLVRDDLNTLAAAPEPAFRSSGDPRIVKPENLPILRRIRARLDPVRTGFTKRDFHHSSSVG